MEYNYLTSGKIPENLVNCAQNDRGFYSCGICHREFSGLNSLRKHVPIHTRRIQHRCDLCSHVFGKREYLLDHVRSHTGEISPVCAVCKQSFTKSLKLKEHMKLHKNLNVDGSVHDVLPYRFVQSPGLVVVVRFKFQKAKMARNTESISIRPLNFQIHPLQWPAVPQVY